MKRSIKLSAVRLQHWFILFYAFAFLVLPQCAGVYDIDPALPTPTILDVTPPCGRVGDTITITGDNFSDISAKNNVRINGNMAVVLLASKTYLNVIVPSRVGSGPVTVGVNDEVATGPSFSNLPTGTVTIADNIPHSRSDYYPIQGIAADASKNIYIARAYTSRVDRKTTTGTATLYAGGGDTGTSYGYANGSGINVLFKNPIDVAVDSKGNVYVSDTGNNCIRKIDPNGNVSLYAGVYNLQYNSPIPGYVDGLRTEAFFSNPRGIAIDQNDNLYVCDSDNARIRKITPDNGNTIGRVTTIAGTGEFGGKDGPALQAMFSTLWDLVVDPDGNLFVSELQEDPRIRKVSADGMVTTIIKGVDEVYYGCKNEAYKLSSAYGIARDVNGNLYCGVYIGKPDDYYSYFTKIITITPDRSIGVLAGGSNDYVKREGTGEDVYLPVLGSLVMVDGVLYASTDSQLVRIDLN